jgi:outer membrane biosynthesis protein TonB
MATPIASSAPQVRSMVAQLRTAHRRSALLHAALWSGLPGMSIAVLASFWSFAAALWVGVLALLVVTGHVLLRLRHTTRQLDLALQDLGEHSLEDALRTWVERDRIGARDAMSDWLGADLTAQVQRPEVRARVVRPFQLGRIRYVIPVLVVLWMVKLLGPDLPMPLPGLLGGGTRAAWTGSGAGNGGPGGTGAPTQDRDPKKDEKPAPEPDQPKPEPPKQDETPKPTPPKPPEPPKPKPEPETENPPELPEIPTPLLTLPEERKVVVPQFIGDGPTRRALAEVALVPSAGGGGATTGSAGGATMAQAQPSSVEFRAAAEKAQQSRHVPPAERAMVRRFFALLQEGK